MRFPGFEDEWETKKLGEICEIKTGNKDTQNKVEDGKYPFFVRSNTIERIDSYSYDGEAILTSGDGVGVGKNFHYINGKFDFHQRVYALRNFEKGYSGKYIYQLFSEKFYDRVKKLSAKNSVDSVRMDMISAMKICFPSSLEQQKIASFLSLLDDRIKTQNKIIKELEVLKTTITKEIFSGQLKLKDENGNYFPQWEEKKLGEVANIKSGLSKEQNDNSYGYKVTRIETISDGTINLNKIGHIDFGGNIDDYKIKKGDILFSNINSVSHIGKTAIAYSDLDLYHGMNLLCIKSKYGLDPLFLYYYLNTVKIRNYFRSICNQAVSQASINQTELAKAIIVLPSLKEQTKIATFLRFICSKIDIEVQLRNQLEEQKKFLLQQMFV